MKNSNYRFTVLATFSFIACACLFAMSTWGQIKAEPQKQGQSQTPIKIGEKGVGGNRPDMRVQDPIDSLKERVDALEAENKELKQQISSTKLQLTGMDKGIADFKKKFDSHYHSYWMSSIPISELANQKDKNLVVLVTKNQEVGIYKTNTPSNP